MTDVAWRQNLRAKIRRDSVYNGQGDGESFEVFVQHDCMDYVVVGGPGGCYRLADVHLFVVDFDGVEVKIT